MFYNEFNKISDVVLHGGAIDWSVSEHTSLKWMLDKMAMTMQNKEHHGEGDVLTHTNAVCEALIDLPGYKQSTAWDKKVLFLAALFHDIGKIKCTKIEDGKLVSPNHSFIGSVMTREILWKDFGLCGDYEKQQMREAICSLVRYHSFPPYAIKDEAAERKILKIASNGELVKGFSLRKLCLLEYADVLGRESRDREEYLDRIRYCEMLAEELECADAPYEFSSDFSERAYFSERIRRKEQELYNDTWGEVILLSGLPGTGKDTWIAKNYPEMPVISLDEIRKREKISPTDNQARVLAIAHEEAKEYLRKKQCFIWNATNTTSLTRAKQISLFERYHASVKTVFLETDWEELDRRNKARQAEVPQAVIEKLLSKLELPERFESERVIWEVI